MRPRDEDSLRSARGIVNGLGLSTAMWIILLIFFWMVVESCSHR
jgi:hypothetical protein